jgi:hypothetical protein
MTTEKHAERTKYTYASIWCAIEKSPDIKMIAAVRFCWNQHIYNSLYFQETVNKKKKHKDECCLHPYFIHFQIITKNLKYVSATLRDI